MDRLHAASFTFLGQAYISSPIHQSFVPTGISGNSRIMAEKQNSGWAAGSGRDFHTPVLPGV